MNKEIIAKIKQKKELQGVPDSYIQELIIKKFPHQITSKKDEMIVLKAIRKELRKVTGRYHTKGEHHVSTKERETFYIELNKRIADLHPHSILDLGCGQNPLFQAGAGVTYYAYDLNEQDIARVQTFFEKKRISGKTKVCDITKEETFPKVDIVLAYKVLDIIDTKGHAQATRILRVLDTTYLLVSFPTISLSGKRMKTTRRTWFEKALLTNGYSYETFSSNNELFYLARRGSNKCPRSS